MTTFKPSSNRCVIAALLFLSIVALSSYNADAWTITHQQSTLSGYNCYRSTAKSTSIVRRKANVATEILMSQIKQEEEASEKSAATTTSPSSQSRKGKRKLPRSERKALERQKKAARNDKKNNKRNTNKGKKNKEGKGYNLHSTAVSQLTASSTAEDVVRAIKRAQSKSPTYTTHIVASDLYPAY